ATHQQQRLNHDFKIISQLGLMGHRLTGNKYPELKKMWEDYKIYALQMKPGSGDGTTQNYPDFPEEKRKELEQFVKEGGMDFAVSINTGGWESHIADTPEARASHQAVNDYIRRITNRPLAWSPSGAYNAWNINDFPYYDIVHGETEMWGPMD